MNGFAIAHWHVIVPRRAKLSGKDSYCSIELFPGEGLASESLEGFDVF